MIFNATERIAAPRTFVFARAVEFDRLTRALEGRGAAVTRTGADDDTPRYAVEYPFRNQMWPVALQLRDQSPPTGLQVGVEASAVSALADFDFREAGAEMTLVALTVKLTAQGMQGRLLLGSLQLVRGRIETRLAEDLGALARAAESMWRAEARR